MNNFQFNLTFVADLKLRQMKKAIIAAILISTFSVAAFAANGGKVADKKTGEEKVSNEVVNEFNADFKDAKNPVWIVTSNSQKVTFTINGEQKSAFYDLAGKYMGLTQTITLKDIPYYAQENIDNDYKGYTVGQVLKYESNGSADQARVTYFVDLKKANSELLIKVIPGDKPELYKTIK